MDEILVFPLSVFCQALPRSILVGSVQEPTEATDSRGGLPILIKTLRGARGIGVTISESLRSLRSLLEMLIARDGAAILQQYLPGSAGIDLKILASPSEVLCAVERRATVQDEFRANVALGGTSRLVAVDDEVGRLAMRALGLVIGSVDVISEADAVYVIEVNDLPELNLTVHGQGLVEPDFARYLAIHLL